MLSNAQQCKAEQRLQLCSAMLSYPLKLSSKAQKNGKQEERRQKKIRQIAVGNPQLNLTSFYDGMVRGAQTLDHISKLTVFDSSHLTEFLCMHNRRQQKWHPEVQMIKK